MCGYNVYLVDHIIHACNWCHVIGLQKRFVIIALILIISTNKLILILKLKKNILITIIIQISTVVDFVDDSLLVNNGQVTFYGLFNDSLLNRSWLNDNKTLILSTPQGGSVHTFAIDTGNILNLANRNVE